MKARVYCWDDKLIYRLTRSHTQVALISQHQEALAVILAQLDANATRDGLARPARSLRSTNCQMEKSQYKPPSLVAKLAMPLAFWRRQLRRTSPCPDRKRVR